ncbi:hypothetical protein ANO11243_045070 [Dothideomycetidae sp. 11243]|nr:hypothetical protein ANO11243_045070 [fungal sp. No.11243]
MRALECLSMDYLFRTWAMFAFQDPRTNFAPLKPRQVIETVDGDAKDFAARKTPGEAQKTHELMPYPATGTIGQRMAWVGELYQSNTRFGDWVIGQPAHDRLQPYISSTPLTRLTHIKFAFYHLLGTCGSYLVFDMAASLNRNDPYFLDMDIPIWSSPPSFLARLPPSLSFFYSSRIGTVSLRALITAANGFGLILSAGQTIIVFALVLAALGLLPSAMSPLRSQPMFGSPVHVLDSGLRGFWSKTWHQTMRFPASQFGRFVGKTVAGREDGMLYVFLFTVTAFTLTGAIHMGIVPPEPLYNTISPTAIRIWVLAFFVSQAFGVIIEDVVVKPIREGVRRQCGSITAGRTAARAVNVLWLIIWCTACLPLLAEPTRQLGYYQEYIIPFGIFRWSNKGLDWGWPQRSVNNKA